MMADAAENRVQTAFWQAAERLLWHHTNPWELDEALCRWGCAIGPCEAQDLVGLDKVLRPDWPGPVLPRMVAEGRLGKIGGVGFYRYPGGGGAVIDPLIEDLILEEAWFGKIARTDLTDEALIAQMLMSLTVPVKELSDQGMDEPSIRRLLQDALYIPKDVPLPFRIGVI